MTAKINAKSEVPSLFQRRVLSIYVRTPLAAGILASLGVLRKKKSFLLKGFGNPVKICNSVRSSEGRKGKEVCEFVCVQRPSPGPRGRGRGAYPAEVAVKTAWPVGKK